MVSRQERQARIQEFFRFSRQEIVGLLAAVVVTAFIFSFRDWGAEQFSASTGLRNLFITILIVAVTFAIRFSAQKIGGLEEGYKGEFKVWWSGLGVSLALALISKGKLPAVLAGALVNTAMAKHLLGEFRYGFSYARNAAIASIGVIANVALATISAAGLYFFPNNYVFRNALILNLVMAACSLIPIKQLDGLHIFFGQRIKYFFLIGMVAVYWLLLMSKTQIGLILGIIAITLLAIVRMLKTSEK